MLKKIGFGTYRVGLGNEEHYNALKYAIESGIRLIDTSANYMDGESEKLIAKVLKDVEIPRDEIVIVTKGGYIQGENYTRALKGYLNEEIVKYAMGCYHSIHPDFLRDQIDRSINRLKCDYIDIYLLHNPEYYLMHSIKTDQDDIKKAQNEMQRRIKEAFKLLEKEVKIGRIRGYGISSNSFSKKPDDLHFLEYKYLIEYAKEAAKEAGNEKHSLKALQMPINLLEQDGIACAKWAKENGLIVMANRPLNAFSKDGMIRLAEYDDEPLYESIRDGVLAQNNIDGTNQIEAIIRELDRVKSEISWCGAVDDVIFAKAVPMINEELKKVKDGPNIEHFIGTLNRFLFVYRQKSMHLISKKAKEELKRAGIIDGNEKLEVTALRFLLTNPNIDVVLIGMRKKTYVDSVLRILNRLHATIS